MKIFENLASIAGNTPLMRLSAFGKLPATVLGKLECFNPAGSVKDRAALSMIFDAEARGALKAGGTIVEPTSGNTGIGFAAYGIPRGYRVILTMPETMSVERRNLLAAYGAEIILTPGSEGMAGAIKKAKELAETLPNAYLPGQFDNPANAEAHEKTTGPEIWADTDGKVDFFVAGVGTGGTLTGVARFLKAKNPNIKIIAVEPETSAVLSGKSAGAHGLQGIGAGFVPTILDTSLIDEVVTVSDRDAMETGKLLAQKEGLLVGISSGAAAFAAEKIANREENAGKTVVALLPDTGERYLPTPMFK